MHAFLFSASEGVLKVDPAGLDGKKGKSTDLYIFELYHTRNI